MSNRAERRAQAKSAQQEGRGPYARGSMKSRRGVVDESSLQDKARRLANGDNGEWKPSGHHDVTYSTAVNPNLNDAKLSHKPRSVKQWFRFVSWTLIVLSAIAFLVVMWIPNLPMWAIVTISAVFIVGVLSLFFVGGSYKENPRLDSYGTAV
ncbi:hypothetical protein [Bombiscardovia coagulans]|uniref:Tripartite tricarboxylate transporter TctB family protein n=1 Tax=Bombiscardovia coagulans TaxID=686666 RepID=A0A261EW86_9BIFI|nr:hypothetical protein [Bombiscardovia coagulans]OZG50936.1 hypothetical protein BOCO_0122 [Bombiscardovia coagulans]